MNYLKEIIAFNESIIARKLSTGQIALWYALMNCNNRSKWAEWFFVPSDALERQTGLSRKGVYNARNKLKEYGLIDFNKGKRNRISAGYKMIPANNTQETETNYPSTTPETTPVTTQEAIINYPKRCNKLPPYINKNKYKQNKTSSSYDLDEFFELALKRSYENV